MRLPFFGTGAHARRVVKDLQDESAWVAINPNNKLDPGRGAMQEVAISKSAANERSWRDFKPGEWQSSIDLRDFIHCNVTPYTGDEEFLAEPSTRTQAVWAKLQPYFKEEQKKG